MKIYLIRHTAVALPQGTCYGQTDVGLSDDWPTAFAQVRAKLPQRAQASEVLVSSPLQRCLRLARSLRSAEVETDPRLMEFNFGRWEGRLWDTITDEEMALWRNDYWSQRVPGGECFEDLYARSTAFFEDLMNRGAQRALVVTHGGVILALLAHVLKLPPGPQVFRLQTDYGGVSEITIEGEWVKICYINR